MLIGVNFVDVLWVVFQVTVKLNDTEEISLSQELASRMALIDNNENRVMEEEINCRSNNLTSNPFSVSVLDRIVSICYLLARQKQLDDMTHFQGPSEQMPDIEQGDKEFS